jgi:hypothetical protein
MDGAAQHDRQATECPDYADGTVVIGGL